MSSSTPVVDAANVVVLVGELSGPPRSRDLPSGSHLVEFDVTTRGRSGTASVPVAWFDPGAAAERLEPGGAVAVVGQVRRRFFRAGGVTQSRTEVVATKVVVTARAAAISRLRARVAELLTSDPATAQAGRL